MNISEANNKYFKILLDNSIVSKSDLDGNITYVNDNFIKALGYSRDECIGSNHNILRHPNTSPTVFKEMWDTIRSGNVYRERVLSKKKDDSDFWSEISIIPLLDDDNKTILEYIAIRRDITDFLYMKRKVHQQKIKEEEQAIIAKAKDDFLILFTHELKTPLNAIINFSQYLLKNIGKISIKKRERLLVQIINSSKTMQEDVTQLLELSKLKSNKLKYHISIFSIDKVLNKEITEHISLANEYKVSVINNISNKNLYIKSDEYRFSQIIANILSNAIKYTNDKVVIELNDYKKYIKLIIKDNGVGVEDKEKIFDLFEQDDENIHTREKKGTGIGLNFVKLLCKDLEIDYEIEKSQTLGGLKFILKIKTIGEKND